MKIKRIFAFLLALAAVFAFTACLRPNASDPSGDEGLIFLPTAEPTAENPSGPDADDPAIELPTAVPTDKPTEKPTEKPTAAPTEEPTPGLTPAAEIFANAPVTEDGVYDTKLEVAHYLVLFGHLPSNFITKKQAQALGWTGGSLEPYAPGKCIGGDYFGNYEHQLPTKKGRTYHECDIGTLGKSSRGAKRLVFSNDGLIYYTGDHYEHFTLIYDGGN